MTRTSTAGLRIGFSFWGFLGAGIIDTPDGGRFWRRPIVGALLAAGHQVIMLQADRDAAEAGQRLDYTFDAGLPDLDVLLAEWRWPLPGRNTTECGAAGHTCDLHRQQQLVEHYTAAGTATIIWDTDRQLPRAHRLRAMPHVVVCEPAVLPTQGAHTLLHPVPDAALDNASASLLAVAHRNLPLVYVGNQYDRDQQFEEFFVPAAAHYPHRVAGKWPRTGRWPQVHFTGRCPFPQVQPIHRRALTTVLLLPERYQRVGHMTQRLFEAVLAGCLPLTPTPIAEAAGFTPERLHVADGGHVIDTIDWARRIAGTREHVELIADCLARLEPFRLSAWTRHLSQVLTHLATRNRP